VATNDFQICKCIRGKHARVPIEHADGNKRLAWEKCLGTVFQEISAVDDPADESALVQEGVLKLSSRSGSLDKKQLQEIAAFVVRHASGLPDSVAGILNQVLQER
jgi:hypothetical protein